jgi:hypothetical protein
VESEEARRAKNTFDLSTKSEVPSDYLPAEPTAFKKRRKKDKVKGVRKTAEVPLFQDEEVATMEEHQEDHGSRESGGATRAEMEKAEKKKQLKDASYLRALSTAQTVGLITLLSLLSLTKPY